MIGYITKNENGEYKTSNSNYTDKMIKADIFDDYEMALCFCLCDEKPVKIVMIEGSVQRGLIELEEEKMVLRKAVELACKENYLNFTPEHFIQQAKKVFGVE